ncbi:MAG TPA: methionyl-tRNA formyltransferase, partial [Limnochordia bacterium]|nr:methionyl-tRNA formyltransferase [Limnochordia bacterium]
AETIAAAALGRLHPRRQDEARATYAAKIERSERVVGWAEAAATLHNRIRGLNPQPGAYTWWRGNRLGLLRTEVAPDIAGPPGRIAAIDRGLVVACGTGGLRILAVKPEGGKAQGALDFVNGRNIAPGDAFDPPRAD